MIRKYRTTRVGTSQHTERADSILLFKSKGIEYPQIPGKSKGEHFIKVCHDTGRQTEGQGPSAWSTRHPAPPMPGVSPLKPAAFQKPIIDDSLGILRLPPFPFPNLGCLPIPSPHFPSNSEEFQHQGQSTSFPGSQGQRSRVAQ